MFISFLMNFWCRFRIAWWRDSLSSEDKCIRGRAWMLRATCWHEVPKVCWALRSLSVFFTCWIGSKKRCFYFLMIKSIFELKGPTSKETQTYRTYSWAFSWELRPTFRVNPSVSRSARYFCCCWYDLFFLQVVLFYDRKILRWRPLGWLLWWSRSWEIALMVQNGFRIILSSSRRGMISW